MASHDMGSIHRLSQSLHGTDILRVFDVDRIHFLPHPVQPDFVVGLRERQEHVLRPADRERGDEGEAAAVDDLLDLPQERVLRFEPLRMLTSGVGGFDEECVAMDGTGPPDEIGRERVQVPREQGGLGPVHFVHRRAGDVAGRMGRDLEVSDVDIVAEVDRPVPAARGPQVAVIERGVEAFRVRNLQRVCQQEVRDVGGRRRQDNVHVLPAGDPRDHPRVVEVGMADEHPVHGRGGHRVLRRVAREQPVIEQEGGRSLLQDHSEAADLRGAAENLKVHRFAVDAPGVYKTFALPGKKSRWQRIARAIRRRPRRIIAVSSSRSDPKNRSAKRLIRTPSAKGPPTAVLQRVSYVSSGVPSTRWSAAVSPAYRPAIIATLFPPPFVAMTIPAASPTNMTLSFTVRGGGPRTGTKPPVAFPGWRPRAATNLLNKSRRFPRKRSQVPRPTFAHPAFGMIHAYPPGARLPKNMSVASLKSPSAVALIAGAETGHSSPTDFATVDRGPSDPTTTFPWNVPRFVSTSSPRTRTTVVSVISSAPSCTACAAIPWSILSRRTVKPRNGMSYRRPFGDQIRMTGVSISRTRYGTSMRSSSSVTVGKIARTSSLWATYSPH